MLDVCLLGTGGMVPLPNRFLTSLYVRMAGSNVLIDCGEGTQVALRKFGFSSKNIDVILLTHFHGDHILGLPGILMSMANSDRTEPVEIIGPVGLSKYISSLCIACQDLPFEVKLTTIESDQGEIIKDPYKITYFKLDHRIKCYGYKLSIDRLPLFNKEKAESLNVPMSIWKDLHHGNEVVLDGKKYTPDMVLDKGRSGLSIVYATDTRPVSQIVNMAHDCDLLVLEGMYGDEEKMTNALKYKHMTMLESVNLAKLANPKEFWLTHYSPSEVNPKKNLEKLQEIFPNTKIVKDGHSISINYED